ncbi:uncharacterized protein LOC127046585 [Gopherus flavomarginatus]|uniref:uncharacterized protein LOC127046585 n=1 Tax=Gopherus flavomarginatus TaxID=286002 RepID=UPI0021CBED5E|nr:uncharacterized protein LOC127046585 [Gopherus flavomarginatus]
MNWQNTTPRLRDDPDVVHRRFHAIFQSHNPDWQDVGQLLDCLLRTEEKERVLRGAREAAEAAGDGRDIIALTNPTQWNPNDSAHQANLKKFLTHILTGIKQAGKRTLDWSKVHNTVQGKEENPSDFYERLCKAFCTFTNIDPKAANTQSMVRLIFISQSAPNIKKRLQQLEGAERKSLEELDQLPQLCATLTQAAEDPILPERLSLRPHYSFKSILCGPGLRQEVHASLWGTSKTDLGTLQTEPV